MPQRIKPRLMIVLVFSSRGGKCYVEIAITGLPSIFYRLWEGIHTRKCCQLMEGAMTVLGHFATDVWGAVE